MSSKIFSIRVDTFQNKLGMQDNKLEITKVVSLVENQPRVSSLLKAFKLLGD